MAKVREIPCMYYTCEGGECKKRGICAHFNDECQTCAKYNPRKGGKPRRTDNRKRKIEKLKNREMRNMDY